MRTVMLAAALAATIILPAHAQQWRLQPRIQREIQADISGLDRQIGRAADRRTISRRDANGLRRDAAQLQRQLNRFSANGLDRREVEQLQSEVNRLRSQLRLERRSWDGRR